MLRQSIRARRIWTVLVPPRKRPPTGTAAATLVAPGPAVHLPAFLHYLQSEAGMSANTIAAYRTDLVQFLEWFDKHGPGSIFKVDLKVLARFLDHLHRRGLASTSIARHLVSLKMFFRYLVLDGVLTESAVELLSSPKLWQHLPKVVSPETVDRILAAPMPDDRYPLRDRALLCFLYATGCRASEASGVRLNDVHLEEGFARCVGKGNKDRIVNLNPVARAAIEAYLKHERPRLLVRSDSDRLFVSRRGSPLSRIMIWNLVKKYAARAGASAEVSPHTLRHSFATHMLAGGAEIRALQEMLGHASVQTTQIYTHVEHSRLKAVHKRCHPRG
jgi:integrase/recombinase XerD